MGESAQRLPRGEGIDPVAAEAREPAAADEGERRETAAPGLEIPPPPPGTRPGDAPLLRRAGTYIADIVRGVWKKGEQDQIFFLAGAISFNVLVAFIPLALAVVGIAGAVLNFQGADAQQTLLYYLNQMVPGAVDANVGPILNELQDKSAGILSVGTLFFLWVATRLVGTLRTVLREIFDIPEGRSIVAGKIFDIKMVVVAGALFALNVALTLGLRIGAQVATEVVGLEMEDIPFVNQATQFWPHLVAFVTIWFMFFVVYRYLPPRRIRWSTAATAATFTALIGEALKFGFGWWVTNANYQTAWGNIATFVILILWIYYTSIVFILGGEVAQVVAMRRVRRRQRERLI